MGKLVVATRLFCLTVIAYLLAQGVFFLTADPMASVGANGVSASSARALKNVSVVPPLEQYGSIHARNLFSARDLPKQGIAEDMDILPESGLGWKLLGTVMSAQASLRRAVVLVGSKQIICKENDKIEGWVIAHIQRGAVIVSNGDVREWLRVEELKLARKERVATRLTRE